MAAPFSNPIMQQALGCIRDTAVRQQTAWNSIWPLKGRDRKPLHSGLESNHVNKLKTISACMSAQGIGMTELVESSGLDPKVVEAIVVGRYTTSPRQRQRLADVLDVSPDSIQWGRTLQVEHMYGHGPQFGRSP